MSERKLSLGASVASILASAGLVASDPGHSPAAAAPAPTPEPSPTPAPAPAPSADANADAIAAAQAAKTIGQQDANARTAAVFASPEALANPKLAAFLLTETEASADKIIQQLSAQAPAAAPAAAAPAAAAPATPAPAQPTVASMIDDTAPAASRDQGNDGGGNDGAVSLEAAFPGLDFTAASPIVEDGFGRFQTAR
jgi:hypothetical protein